MSTCPGAPDLLVGADTGDDAAVVRLDGGRAVISTVDFFTPVVDDPYDWGRIVAANAMSDVWAMGGEPVLAINLVGWPRDGARPRRCSSRCCAAGPTSRGRRAARSPAATPSTRRSRSTAWPSPASATRTACCARTPRVAGLPLSLTKPLGVGVLTSRHKATGEVFPQAVASHDRAQRRGVASGGRGRAARRRPTSPASGCSGTCSPCCGPRGWVRGSTSRPCRCSTARARRCATGTSAAARGATSSGCARTSTSARGVRGRPGAARRRADERRAARRRRGAGGCRHRGDGRRAGAHRRRLSVVARASCPGEIPRHAELSARRSACRGTSTPHVARGKLHRVGCTWSAVGNA